MILIGLVIVFVAIIGVLAMAMCGGNDDETSPEGVVNPTSSATTETAAEGGLTGKAKSTINVRSDPGNEFQALGTLRKDSEVEIVAKSEDGEWLQIVYPQRSRLRGWVPADSLEISGDPSVLAVATPDHIPVVEAPTSAPVTETPVVDTPTPEQPVATETPSVPPTPTAGPPDLVIAGALISGGSLVVTVTNQGGGPLLNAVLSVTISDGNTQQVLYSTASGPYSLSAGESIDVSTGYSAFDGPMHLLLYVQAQGVAEADESNNSFSVAVSGGN